MILNFIVKWINCNFFLNISDLKFDQVIRQLFHVCWGTTQTTPGNSSKVQMSSPANSAQQFWLPAQTPMK